jgi:peptidoglycan hydrolase CwlO-like protein
MYTIDEHDQRLQNKVRYQREKISTLEYTIQKTNEQNIELKDKVRNLQKKINERNRCCFF